MTTSSAARRCSTGSHIPPPCPRPARRVMRCWRSGAGGARCAASRSGIRFRNSECGMRNGAPRRIRNHGRRRQRPIRIPHSAIHNQAAAMADYFVHESSYVDDGAKVGRGTKICHFCHVMPGAEIGERCNLGQNVVIMPGTRIGNNVKIQNNVSIYQGVVLEDDVFCGPSCVFTNVLNPRSHVSRKAEYRQTLVKRGSSIGANATIVCGVTLGEYAFIGAGAVVTSDVPAYGLMVGVPARRVGWMCQCGERLLLTGSRATCAACGAAYEEGGAVLRQTVPPAAPR